ncbi:MAG: hypothetical protein HW421_2399 [Ignavibacteria bacterium]|nr:hypothetical protein [Ignavibacteria bacterium]
MKFTMRKTFFTLFTLILFSGNLLANSSLMQAMRDEIKRSIDSLSLDKLQKPYFIEYSLIKSKSKNIKASLGSLIESDSNSSAYISVSVRVGNYKFDNTNFFDVGLGFFGSGDDEESFKLREIPQNPDYKTLRRELWLATDAAYKQAAEIYSKKEAAIKNRLRQDTTHDFTRVTPQKLTDTFSIPKFDTKEFEEKVKSLSVIFSDYPEIQTSQVVTEYLPKTIYYVNSEGREYVRTDLFTGIEVVATAQSSDGMPLQNIYSAYSLSPSGLPSKDSLFRAIKGVAEKLKSLTVSGKLSESYSGPMLFEGQAAAEIFAQIFAPNLVSQREVLSDGGLQESERYGAFQSKIGGRVLPEFLSVSDNPKAKNFSGTELIGNYSIDDDGMESVDTKLVEHGFLKTLLSSRIPTKRVRASNGHKRGGAPCFSNPELHSDAEHIKSPKELKEKLIELCKNRELPFGIIVRKTMNQNIMFTTLYRVSGGGFQFSQGGGKVSVVEAYKVFPDGSEELIRGSNINGLTVQSFKDILLTGRDKYVLNLLAPAVVSPFFTGGSQYLSASMIVPDLLFEDCELKPVEDDFPKLPFLSNPLKSD